MRVVSVDLRWPDGSHEEFPAWEPIIAEYGVRLPKQFRGTPDSKEARRVLSGLAFRAVRRECARYAQHLLASYVAEAFGFPADVDAVAQKLAIRTAQLAHSEGRLRAVLSGEPDPGEWTGRMKASPGETPFRRFAGHLDSRVRCAIDREVRSVWGRFKRATLAGDREAPGFGPERAMSVPAPAATFVRDGDQYRLSLAVVKDLGPVPLFVWQGPRFHKDEYLPRRLEAIAEGRYRLAAVKITARGKRLRAHLQYESPRSAAATGAGTATLGPLQEDGSLWLRSAHSGLDLTDIVTRIREMRGRHGAILRRHRKRIGRRPGWRSRYRRTVDRRRRDDQGPIPASYERWADTECATLASLIVKWLVQRGVSTLTVAPLVSRKKGEPEDVRGAWPAHLLRAKLNAKCEEAGIACSDKVDVTTDSARRAIQGAVRQQQRRAAKEKKTAARMLQEV